MMPAYRITVDALDPTTGEGGLESLSFFASTHNDILTAANSLRDRLNCSACHATKLAVGLSLLSDELHDRSLFTSLHEPVRNLLRSLQAVIAEAG
jgi:hypothetical protein